MKKTLALFLVVLLVATGFAQNETHKWGFGMQISAVDFSGPISKSYFDFDEHHGVARLFASRYLNASFDLTLDMTVGKVWAPTINNYPDAVTEPALERHFYGWNALVEYKFNNGYIFKEDAIVAPYIFTGAGMSWLVDYPFESHAVNAHIPFGLGLDIRATDWLTFNVQSSYQLSLDNHFDYTQHSAGITLNFGKAATRKVDKEKDKEAVDSDEDGVPDLIDECPFAAGTSDFFGCPDSDGDGLGDSRDECPQLAGSKMNKGCPSMDSDEDGVPDDKDNCPDAAGEARYAGCPDSDGDGIIDKYDNCPEEKGVASNNGCPKDDEDTAPGDGQTTTLPGQTTSTSPFGDQTGGTDTPVPPAEDSYKVFFATGSDFLDANQKKVIEDVAEQMEANPNWTLKINGYADARGDEANNMTLSLERGVAVWEILETMGVSGDRVVIYAFGEYFPRGRGYRENRVVEMVFEK